MSLFDGCDHVFEEEPDKDRCDAGKQDGGDNDQAKAKGKTKYPIKYFLEPTPDLKRCEIDVVSEKPSKKRFNNKNIAKDPPIPMSATRRSMGSPSWEIDFDR